MVDLSPRGVFSASATAFAPDGSVDLGRTSAHCRRLIVEGCHGIALLGTTGEANSLSTGERKALLEAVLGAGVQPGQLLPGTGVSAIPETIDLTRHALSLGVESVVVLPPFYYKGVSDDGIVETYSRIVEGVGDARLKVVLYHIPQMTQVPIAFDAIARLRDRFPGVFVAIKDSAGDLDHMIGLVETFPGLAVLAGADPLMAPLLAKGGAGCITATSNIVATELRHVYDAGGDLSGTASAAAAQARIVAMRTVSSRFVQIPTIKAMIAAKIGDPVWANVRPPLVPLTKAEQAEVTQLMKEVDLAGAT